MSLTTTFPQVPISHLGKIDKSTGSVHISPDWLQFFNQVSLYMQTVHGSTALVPPSLSSDPANNQFTTLTNAPISPLNGSLVYDTHTNSQKIWINGAYKTITVS